MARNRAVAVSSLIGLTAVLIAAATAVWSAPPLDADSGGPLALWFRGLRQPGTGKFCCDVSDCRRTIARRAGNDWEAQTPAGGWVPVPPSLALRDTVHPAGAAVLCWRPAAGVVCFIPPRDGG